MTQSLQPGSAVAADVTDLTEGRSARPAVTIRGLSFGYRPGQRVLDRLDADLVPGRVTALIGPNATGKTTLLRLILGRWRPDAGQVRVGGVEAVDLDAVQRARRLAYVGQRSAVAFRFSVRQIVTLGRFAQRQDGGRAVAHAIEVCGLGSVADRAFHELSGGQQQRVAVARALAQSGFGERGDDRVLLLDEPVASADLRHAHQTLGLLQQAAREGRAVLVVLHDLNLAARWADAVWLMDGGRLVAAGPWEQVLTAAQLEPVYGVQLTPLRPAGSDRPVFHAVLPPPGCDCGVE